MVKGFICGLRGGLAMERQKRGANQPCRDTDLDPTGGRDACSRITTTKLDGQNKRFYLPRTPLCRHESFR